MSGKRFKTEWSSSSTSRLENIIILRKFLAKTSFFFSHGQVSSTVKPCPKGLANWMHWVNASIWKSRTCVRTCDGWPNVLASRLANSCMQVAKSRKFHPYTADLRSTCVQTMKNLCRISYEFELDQSQRKLSHAQVHASGRPNEKQVERKSKLALTGVDLRKTLTNQKSNQLNKQTINPGQGVHSHLVQLYVGIRNSESLNFRCFAGLRNQWNETVLGDGSLHTQQTPW